MMEDKKDQKKQTCKTGAGDCNSESSGLNDLRLNIFSLVCVAVISNNYSLINEEK